MRDARHDQVPEVVQHHLEPLALLGGLQRERGPHITGLDLCQDRELAYLVEVGGDPIDDIPCVRAKVLRRHVPGDSTHRFCRAQDPTTPFSSSSMPAS